MSTYLDMSEYSYKKGPNERPSKNIGWLGRDVPFPTGRVHRDIISRLEILSCIRFNQTRGFCKCPLCGADMVANSFGALLGSAEIKVFFQSTLYSSPNLIVHFIKEHSYLPPEEYIDAVSCMEDPMSNEAVLRYRHFGLQMPNFSDNADYVWGHKNLKV